MAYKWGLVTNHLLNGMILQVGICGIDPIELLGGSPQDGRKWLIDLISIVIVIVP